MTPLHLIDLGPDIPSDNLKALLKSSWDTELVRGIMQTIREFGFDSIRAAKEGIKEKNDAWIHSQLGQHEACESIVASLYEIAKPMKSEMEQ